MKVSVFKDNDEQRVDMDLFLARHNTTGALAIFGRHAGIILEAEKYGTIRGDGYSDQYIKSTMFKDYTPLPLGTKVTLENEAAGE